MKKNSINRGLISATILGVISTTGVGTVQTVLATDTNTLEDVKVIKEEGNATTVGTEEIATLEEDKEVQIETEDINKIDNTDKENIKEVVKAVNENKKMWVMEYKSNEVKDYLNAHNTDFKYNFDVENKLLKVKYKDLSEQEMSIYEENGEFYSQIAYKFSNNEERSEVVLGVVKIDLKNKSVESIATDYIYFSPEVLENKALEPLSNVYTTDNFEHTVMYKNTEIEGKYVIQKYATADEVENLYGNEDNTLLLYENRADAVFLEHNLRHITKKEVMEQSDIATKFDTSKDYVDFSDENISLTTEDIAIIHNHFYPTEEGYNYINATNTTSSKLAYMFNGKGDLTFKIDNILDTNANLNAFKYVFTVDDTLKTSDTYQTMVGQTREKSYKIYMNDLQQTNEIRLRATFNADTITVEVDRDSIVGIGKTSEIYALSMFIDTFEAPYIEEPKEEPKEPKKVVKEEVVKPKTKKLPKAGNSTNVGIIATISTILGGTTGLYIFRRR